MEFTDSQIYFINQSIRKALREEEKFIKYWTDLAQKENDIGKKRNYNDLQNQCSKFMREIVKHKCKAYGKQTMGLCDCMMKLASPELLDIAIDKLFSFCKIDLPGQKLLIKQGVTQSRSYFTPERERSYYTKRKVQGVQYFIFSTKVGDVEENVLICFSGLCEFYGYCHKNDKNPT